MAKDMKLQQSYYNARCLFVCLSVCHTPLAPSLMHGRKPTMAFESLGLR